jgi:hypothetical protein
VQLSQNACHPPSQESLTTWRVLGGEAVGNGLEALSEEGTGNDDCQKKGHGERA